MIVCRSRSEIEKLRRVNQLVGQILAELRQMVRPGVTTQDIDAAAEATLNRAGQVDVPLVRPLKERPARSGQAQHRVIVAVEDDRELRHIHAGYPLFHSDLFTPAIVARIMSPVKR